MNLRSLFALTGLVLAPSLAWGDVAETFPTFVTIYDFSSSNRWDQCRLTELKTVQESKASDSSADAPQVRFETLETRWVSRKHFSSDRPTTPVSLLTDLQKLALLRMLNDGYITQSLFDSVAADSGTWKPLQVRYAISWSELTLGQAKELFHGEIPWERIVGASHHADVGSMADFAKTLADSSKIKVIRAGAMLGLGHQVDPQTGELLALPLGWESEPGNESIRDFNRGFFKMAAEFKRVVSEKSPLPGDRDLVFQALFGLLRREATLLEIPFSRVALFGEFLSERRAKHFQKIGGGFRLWNPALKHAFDMAPEKALRYFERIPPTSEIPPRSVFFNTLERFRTRLELDDISQRSRDIQRLSGTPMPIQEAEFLGNEWDEFLFQNYRFSEQENPVFALNLSLMRFPMFVENLRRYGISTQENAETLLNNLVQRRITELHPFSSFGEEPFYTIPSGNLPHTFEGGGIRISNLSPQAVQKYGDRFPASVLLSILHSATVEMQSASIVARANLLLATKQYGLPTANGLRDFFTAFPLQVGTADPTIAASLARLGGKHVSATAVYGPDMKIEVTINHEGITAGAKIADEGGASIYIFPTDVLDEIAKSYPDIQPTVDCPKHLRFLALMQRAPHY